MLLAVLVDQQIGGAFHGMTRSMQHADRHLAHLEFLAILRDVRIETRVGVRSVHDRGAGLLRKVHMAAHEIRMEVRFQHVLDLRAALLRPIDVRLCFA